MKVWHKIIKSGYLDLDQASCTRAFRLAQILTKEFAIAQKSLRFDRAQSLDHFD